MTTQSTINPAIPIANSTLSSGPIRSQFQAAANDINNIYGLIAAYPLVVQKSPNMVVSSTGQMQRSAFGIPITISNVWSILAHDGVSEFYTTPTYVANFVSTGYTGPAIVFQGYDWYIYAVNALTGALLTGFPVATSGPCYGRVVASNIDTDGYAGMTMVFGCTHGGTQGSAGAIIALHSDGTSAWTAFNAFADEGGNDMFASCANTTTTTLSAAITTTGQTAISVTSGANIANGNFIQCGTEIMLVSAGGGTSSLTVVRAQEGSTAVTHLINAAVNTGFNTLGNILTTGLTVASATTSSVTVSGSPGWVAGSWTRIEGLGFGAYIAIVSGTGAGQTMKEIISASGATLNINGTWAVTPDATSKLQICPRYISDAYFQHAGTLSVETGVTYLYTTGFDNTIVKRLATAGTKQWRYWTGENNEPYPLIAPVADGVTNSVTFNSGDGYTYNLSLAGALNWRTQNYSLSLVKLDSFPLGAFNFSNSGTYLNIAVNSRRSGQPGAGRCYTLRGDTGAKVASSTDQLGDNSSGALPIPRNDGTGKYWIYSAGNACMPTLYDDQMNGLWRVRLADNSGIDQFRSSPFLADVNYDGVNEIVHCMQNTATVMVFSLTGQVLAELTLPSRLNANDGGIEGSPCTFIYQGILYTILPSKDGTIGCWKFNQNAG